MLPTGIQLNFGEMFPHWKCKRKRQSWEKNMWWAGREILDKLYSSKLHKLNCKFLSAKLRTSLIHIFSKTQFLSRLLQYRHQNQDCKIMRYFTNVTLAPITKDHNACFVHYHLPSFKDFRIQRQIHSNTST